MYTPLLKKYFLLGSSLHASDDAEKNATEMSNNGFYFFHNEIFASTKKEQGGGQT